MTTPQTDRTPRPCTHPKANHQHGTRACYVHDHCKCYPCAAANSNYAAGLNRQRAYGRSDLIDAGPARQHVRTLMAAGMGWKTVARAAGVTASVIASLLYGKALPNGTRREPTHRLRQDTTRKILAVRLALAPKAHLDPTIYTRRLRALVALGWSQAKLATQLGVSPGNFTPLMAGTRNITVTTSKAILDLYAELSMQLPPEATHRDRIAASRARTMAKARGWVPPFAWDDDELDDPTAVPVAKSA